MNKLGDRLRKADVPAEEDLNLLATIRLDYDEPMQRVRTRVEGIAGPAAAVVPRLKTTATIVEKLKREATRLATMQDIAGVRLVADMTLTEQDRIVRRIEHSLNVIDVYDLRDKPRYGYRAFHVVVEDDECPVEIQIRTEIQNEWAQTMEGYTDVLGREIKYALPDDTPTLVLDLVRLMTEWSDGLARIERNRDRAIRIQLDADALAGQPDSRERRTALEALADEFEEVAAEDEAISLALDANRVGFRQLREAVERLGRIAETETEERG